MRRRREHGAVLIWALATLATATAVAAGIGTLALGSQNATWQLTARAQADALLRSGVTLAAVGLEAHARTGLPDVANAPWNRRGRHDHGAGWIEFEIEDVARRLDLNAPELRPALRRLVTALELPPTLVPTIIDWIDGDDVARRGGAERNWYASRTPALLPANAPIESIHHLGHLRDVTPATVARLAPYVTVHGHPALNPNTATETVLDAWLGDRVLVERMLAERRHRPLDCTGLRHCTTQSRRFLVRLRARVGGVERAADVTLLVPRALPAAVVAWEPPVVPWSDGGGDARRAERRPQ